MATATIVVEAPLHIPDEIELASTSRSERETSFVSQEPVANERQSGLEVVTPSIPDLSIWRTAVIIGTVVCTTLMNSMLAGLLIVSLPTMAKELELDDSLLLWPASVSALTSGCTLLISGSISDVIGGRKIYLTGCFLLTVTTIACGVCRTGIELIMFRALQGIALSLCLPSSVQLITANIPTGSRRNIAFACLGAGQPSGFAAGLVLSGFFVQGIGWRYGFYITAIVTFCIFLASIFGVPKDRQTNLPVTWNRMFAEIDWTGCLLLSASLGLFSYVLSILAGGISNLIAPAPIALLVIAALILPIFGYHTRRQERLARPAIIPPSLWTNLHFTSLCGTVFLVWATFNAMQYFITLYQQSVLQLSPSTTSLQFLPMVVTGASTNFVSGHLVSRVSANVLVLVSAAISAVSPLIMATVDTKSSYWLSAFWATALTPICADTLFTVSNLVITRAFPERMHGVAGGVFNTVSNIGNSVGLAITAVIASSVTMAIHNDETDVEKLMDGYRAVFWTCFALSVTVLVVAGFGMRSIGKVGVKRD